MFTSLLHRGRRSIYKFLSPPHVKRTCKHNGITPGFAMIGPTVCLIISCTLNVGTPAVANSNSLLLELIKTVAH